MESSGHHTPIKKPPEIISYYTMRRAIGIMGITFPVILLAGSYLFGDCQEVQLSISAYYHTNMRNVFVGLNCGVALFLFSYRGHDRWDNLAGYLGCVFALGVAFLPCTISSPDPPCLDPVTDHPPLVGSLHLLSAGLFFATLIFYTLIQFPKTYISRVTGEKMAMGPQKRKRNIVFYFCGSIMMLAFLLMVGYMWFLKDQYPGLKRLDPVFWLESVSLVLFGISWLTKGQLFFRDPDFEN